MKAHPVDELVVITPYFNPCHYLTRRKNYGIFLDGIARAGVRCITIECAFGGDDFELAETADVMRIRARDVLWQKERLINLAAASLPRQCKHVAILDGDILFENKCWVDDLMGVMQTCSIAQVFESALMLDEHGDHTDSSIYESFSSVMSKHAEKLVHSNYAVEHGHSGLGWVMHREILDSVGLYEAGIVGGSDHFLTHACFNDFGKCLVHELKNNERIIAHLEAWARRFYPFVMGNVGVVPGRIRHLWHGDFAKRRYVDRMHDVIDLGFDPWTDLKVVDGMPLEWTGDVTKPELRQFVSSYFACRDEDGLRS